MAAHKSFHNKYIQIFAGLLSLLFLLCSCGPDTGHVSFSAEGISDYDKSIVIERVGGDLDSDLSVFPDEMLTDEATYSADFGSNLFDTDGFMILACTYDKATFAGEVSRLQGLSKTITYNDEQYTNKVLYDEASYAFPAYITIDGFGNTYEYALIDEPANRIVYAYLAYPGGKILQEYSDYAKKDLSAYEEENTFGAFSMYNHSFDGGESWIEFDDSAD